MSENKQAGPCHYLRIKDELAGESLDIGAKIPMRQLPVILRTKGSKSTVIGRFRSVEDADWAITVISGLCRNLETE